MSKPEQAYHEHYRRQHRVFGAYLSIHCWHNGYDAVIVPREVLARFHELKKFTTEHLEWFKNDIRPFFPHFSKFIFSKTPAKFAAVALSRVPISVSFGTGARGNVDRAERGRSEGFRVAAMEEILSIPQKLSERDAAAFLSLMASGLTVPGTPRAPLKQSVPARDPFDRLIDGLLT